MDYKSVLETLKTMPSGTIKNLDKDHANYEKFVSLIKYIIEWEYDLEAGFSITFSDDFAKIKKHQTQIFYINLN